MTRDLLFVDIETTGLNPTVHEILEVAAIRTTPDGLAIKQTYEAKIQPENLAAAEPKALEINRYTKEEWAPELCSSKKDVVAALTTIAKDAVLVGQNVSFDESFLTVLFRNEQTKPSWWYHKVDTHALAWPLYIKGLVSNASLAQLCEYFRIPQTTTHRAMPDTLACREVYLHLMTLWLKEL